MNIELIVIIALFIVLSVAVVKINKVKLDCKDEMHRIKKNLKKN